MVTIFLNGQKRVPSSVTSAKAASNDGTIKGPKTFSMCLRSEYLEKIGTRHSLLHRPSDEKKALAFDAINKLVDDMAEALRQGGFPYIDAIKTPKDMENRGVDAKRTYTQDMKLRIIAARDGAVDGHPKFQGTDIQDDLNALLTPNDINTVWDNAQREWERQRFPEETPTL